MFNLLMSGNDEAFRGEPWTLERGRVFEYTSDAIANRFRELTPENLTELCSFPALISYERPVNQNARLAKIDRVRIRQAEVRIEYSYIQGLPEIPSEQLFRLEWELDIQGFEQNRTHWAVKDVDLCGELISANVFTEDHIRALPVDVQQFLTDTRAFPQAQVQPTVFRVPETPIENDLASVMLPFDAAFTPVFDALAQAGQQVGLRVLNANQLWDETEIIQDIFSLIYRSKFVICDFSTRNPNVFYEAGIAHTLGRPVIPIVQTVEHIPFDLRHHRHIIYLNNAEGRRGLINELVPRMRTLAAR